LLHISEEVDRKLRALAPVARKAARCLIRSCIPMGKFEFSLPQVYKSSPVNGFNATPSSVSILLVDPVLEKFGLHLPTPNRVGVIMEQESAGDTKQSR
jgi:hypothetical protein